MQPGRSTSRRDGVRHEQDPQSWLDAVDAVLAEVTEGPVDGIAICSTSGTFLLTDLNGRPVTPALMYDDARAADRRDRIVDADPDRWSTAMQPTWALPKILALVADGYDLTTTASSTAPTSSRPTWSVTPSPQTPVTPSRPATT